MRVLKRNSVTEARNNYADPQVWLNFLSDANALKAVAFLKNKGEFLLNMSKEDQADILRRLSKAPISNRFQSSKRAALLCVLYGLSSDTSSYKYEDAKNLGRKLKQDLGLTDRELEDLGLKDKETEIDPSDIIWGMDSRYSFPDLSEELSEALDEDIDVYQTDIDDSRFEFGDGLANFEEIKLSKDGVLTAIGDFGNYRQDKVSSIEDVDACMKKWFKAVL